MKRRDFLKRGLATAGGAMLADRVSADAASAGQARVVKTAQAATPGGHYMPNRAPLLPTAFQKLPPGSIAPKGWLRHQLDLQVNGLCGRMTDVSDYLKFEGNGWVDPHSETGWEEVTYWLRGFGDLGYVTGDTRILALNQKWMDGILANQRPDGWFGPLHLQTSLDGGPDMWPHMPLLNALQSYYEYSSDRRVLPFLTRYFAFQNTVAPSQFIKSWAGARWGDNIETIYWLYNRTGETSLLNLAHKIHAHSADYVNTVPTWHNVNLAQGFREPAEYGLLSHDPKYLQATVRVYDTVMDMYGQFPGGGFAGDETCRAGFHDPRQGFETCGMVEFMHSFQMLTRMTGDTLWADRCEDVAFNSLPAAFDPEQKGTHYITSANSIRLDNNGKHHGQFSDGAFPMQAFMPGVHNYRCCPHNYGMGWPYYAEELWLATADGGLCASMYAASVVTAKVGGGTVATLTQETDYPFGDTVRLAVSVPKAVAFPLYLRVPGWCEGATARVNGKPVPVDAAAGSYVVVHRTWKTGDVLTLHLPMRTTVRTWAKNANSVSVNHGPLTFSLAMGETWNKIGGTDAWPEFEVLPATAWNYGLALRDVPAQSFDITRKAGTLAPNPFTPATCPIEMRAKARRIAAWQADADQVVGTLQPSPARTEEPLETVTLIPMGAARLRITAFPTVSDGADAHAWVAPLLPAMTATASYVYPGDTTDAMNDGRMPVSSFDMTIPRFTWYDHLGTTEWVQYDWKSPVMASGVSVYWFDDAPGNGKCRVPKSWRVLYQQNGAWVPVPNASSGGTARDAYNTVTFAPVTTTALKVEVQLQEGFSGGILEWTVQTPPMRHHPASTSASY